MTKKKPTILVVNDDGITAPGIKVLIEEMQKIANEVVNMGTAEEIKNYIDKTFNM